MPIDIKIPEMGESVTHGVIATWRKKDGDFVNRDETVLDLETDKITAEIPAPAAGVLKTAAKVGDQVPVGAIVGTVDDKAAPTSPSGRGAAEGGGEGSPSRSSPPLSPTPNGAKPTPTPAATTASPSPLATPLARKLADEHHLNLATIPGSGAGGRIREQDVLAAIKSPPSPPGRGAGGSSAGGEGSPSRAPSSPPSPASPPAPSRREKMSPLRQRVAARLVEAQHTAAMLTTFNEADMTAVMDLRKAHKEAFEKKHGVGLGFMSFFVKAAVQALKAFPTVNASIVSSPNGEMEVEYHATQDIAVAVGTPKGLVVPVLRDCDRLSFAQIESGVKDLATRARDNKLTLKDLQGGTFTITNGGIYGSLMSTPILNPPQTGILGMHAIKPRPIEHPPASGQLAVRPMMYLALSYDHRLVDGAEAVQFLVTIKNAIESPERLLLGV